MSDPPAGRTHELRDTRSPALPEQAAVETWLGDRLGVSSLTIDNSSLPALNGASNETLLIDTSWTAPDGTLGSGSFVVRRPPKSFPLFHHYDLEQQYRTMQALADTDVPVPPLVGLELDPSVVGEPFYVMELVEGRPPPDLPPFTTTGWVLEAAPDEQARMYAASIEMLSVRFALAANAGDHLTMSLNAAHQTRTACPSSIMSKPADWQNMHPPLAPAREASPCSSPVTAPDYSDHYAPLCR